MRIPITRSSHHDFFGNHDILIVLLFRYVDIHQKYVPVPITKKRVEHIFPQ